MTHRLGGGALLTGLALAIFACADDRSGDDLPPGAFTSGPQTGDDDMVVATSLPGSSSGGEAEGSSSSGEPTPSDESTGPPQEVSFQTQLQPVIETFCFGAGCHDDDAPGSAGGLNLSPDGPDDPYTNLTTRMHGFSGMPYVTVGELQDSYLWRKLQGTQLDDDLENSGSGGRMPLAMDPLSAENMTLFRDWILTGAMP